MYVCNVFNVCNICMCMYVRMDVCMYVCMYTKYVRTVCMFVRMLSMYGRMLVIMPECMYVQ